VRMTKSLLTSFEAGRRGAKTHLRDVGYKSGGQVGRIRTKSTHSRLTLTTLEPSPTNSALHFTLRCLTTAPPRLPTYNPSNPQPAPGDRRCSSSDLALLRQYIPLQGTKRTPGRMTTKARAARVEAACSSPVRSGISRSLLRSKSLAISRSRCSVCKSRCRTTLLIGHGVFVMM
jgi:hypothetical protein